MPWATAVRDVKRISIAAITATTRTIFFIGIPRSVFERRLRVRGGSFRRWERGHALAVDLDAIATERLAEPTRHRLFAARDEIVERKARLHLFEGRRPRGVVREDLHEVDAELRMDRRA